MTMIENKKIFLKWWLSASLVYLVIAIILTWNFGTGFLIPLGDDTAHHLKLAENLIKYQIFSLDGLNPNEELKVPLKPTNFLTPGYAFWLAAIYLMFKSFTPAIFIGAIFFALAVPLTYFLGLEFLSNKKAAAAAAFVFMVEPLSIYHSGLLFTEQLFLPIFLAAIFFFIKYFETDRRKLLIISLALFSFGTLVRPIIFYILPILPILVLVKESKISWRKGLILSFLALFLVYSLIGVWILRNKIVLNSWQISNNQNVILGYHYQTLRQYIIKSRGFDPGDIDVAPPSFYSADEYSNVVGLLSAQKLWQYKWDYLKLHLYFMPLFFLSNGYDNIMSRFEGEAYLSARLRNDLIANLLNGDIRGVLKSVAGASARTWFSFGGVILWFLISVLALFGIVRAFFKNATPKRQIIGGMAFLIIYFSFISAPLIAARYRLPVNPLIFIFAVSGFIFLKSKIKNHEA